MNAKKLFYWFFCALGVLIGLYPSIFLNVGVSWSHGHYGYALLQLTLSIMASVFAYALFKVDRMEACLLSLILCGILLVSVGNAVEAIALDRGELVSDRNNKLGSHGDWTARVEEWKAERDTLKARYIPTTEESVRSAQRGVDDANEARQVACKYVSKACDDRTRDAKAAQDKLDQASHNLGLTRRIEKLERDIERGRDKIRELGDIPSDHIAKAQAALSWLFINPVQNKEMITAFVAEGAAAFGPKFMIFIVGLLFVSAFGENWTDSPTNSPLPKDSPVLHEARESLSKEEISFEMTDMVQLQPPQKKPATGKIATYLEGVEAWLDEVKPVPGRKNERYTPGELYPHYKAFCESEGFKPCLHSTTLGTMLRNHCGVKAACKMGGSYRYEFNLGGVPRLAYVKTAS